MFTRAQTLVRLHPAATFIALAFFLLATVYSTVTPLFESPDEVWHYPFVWHLSRTWELPVQDPTNPQLWFQEGSQAPLYYAIAALLTAPIPTDDLPELIDRNPHADIGVVSPDGNANIVVHTGQEHWPWRGAVLAIHLIRIFSALLGTGTVIATYALGRILWPTRPRFALLAMTFVAFNPMFIFLSGSVNNDNLITLLASLAIWFLAAMTVSTIQHGQAPTWPQFMGLGLITGLALLAKATGLALLGWVGLSLLWLGFRQRSWRIAIGGNMVVTAIALLIAGWWYWRNLALYGEFTGTAIIVQMMGPRPFPPTIDHLLGELTGMSYSFWGLFGYFSVPMPVPLYWILNTMLGLGFLGLVATVALKNSDRLPTHLTLIAMPLLAWLMVMLAGWLQYNLRIQAAQGRLLFPAIVVLAVLWAAGWMAWMPPRWHWLPSITLLLVAVWAPFGVIAPAYAVPDPFTGLPSTAQPLAATFGNQVELLGYEQTTPTARPGDQINLTFYWRGLQPMATDYTVFLHLLDENQLIVAQRDVYHGPGVYPTSQWLPGSVFRDSYVLRLPNTTPAPTTGRFALGLYDAASGQRLPLSEGGDLLQFGTIQVIRDQPGDRPNPQYLLFEDNILLTGYEVDRQQAVAGQTVTVTLYWQGDGTPSEDYKVFVHVVGQGDNRIAQHDSEPQNGSAPTGSWKNGQVIVDPHPLTIAPDAPPGAYTLVMGLYHGETGQRLRLLRDGTQSVQASAVTLTGLRIKP